MCKALDSVVWGLLKIPRWSQNLNTIEYMFQMKLMTNLVGEL